MSVTISSMSRSMLMRPGACSEPSRSIGAGGCNSLKTALKTDQTMERALELTASSTIRPPQTKPQHQQQMARRIRSELLREGQPRKPQRKAQGSTLLNIKAEKLQQAAGLGTFTILAGHVKSEMKGDSCFQNIA